MEPPTKRMVSVNAVAVAISESGQAVMAIVAAGTITPPIPNPAIVAKPTARPALSGFTAAMLPVNAASKRNVSVLDSLSMSPSR